MLAFLIFTIEILVSYLLQSTVFASLQIAGAVPDLLIIVAVAAGYQNSRLYGMGVGFFCGLILDIGSGGTLGVFALFYMVIGYLSGHFSNYYVQRDIFFPLMLITVAEFGLCTAIYVFGFLIRGDLQLVTYVKSIFIPKILYTVVVAIIYYLILDFLYERVLNRKAEDESFLAPESILQEPAERS
ncbi:MAG: rod shape-determining protein MreD [Lachnospiraceae bacterium]|nr:rod shape-determining protein MreD [Lachnospiraceae bacterium]